MPGESARINGRKGGRPEVIDPTTGKWKGSGYYANMKAAALGAGVSVDVVRHAKNSNCNAFGTGCQVHKERFRIWLEENPPLPDSEDTQDEDQESESYETPEDIGGGIGQVLKSLLSDERRCKKALDKAVNNTTLSRPEKAALVKEKRSEWLKVSGTLLKYELNVAAAKRDAGELIPLADAQKGVQALLAWLCVADSDALRNAIPELENKNRYQIAAIIDPIFRGSKLRNFKLGEKLGKIPEWLSATATTFIKQAPMMGSEKTLEEQLDEY